VVVDLATVVARREVVMAGVRKGAGLDGCLEAGSGVAAEARAAAARAAEAMEVVALVDAPDVCMSHVDAATHPKGSLARQGQFQLARILFRRRRLNPARRGGALSLPRRRFVASKATKSSRPTADQKLEKFTVYKQ